MCISYIKKIRKETAILSPLLSPVFCVLFLSKLRKSQRCSGDASGGAITAREIESKPVSFVMTKSCYFGKFVVFTFL